MDATQSLTIRWVSSVDDIPQDLWERCFPSPLEGRWWYAALEQGGLEARFKIAYGLIEDHGESVGIAPIFVMELPWDLIAPDPIARLLRSVGRWLPRLRFQRTLFVGSPCADEGTVGLIPSVPLGRVAPALQEELEQRARQERAGLIVWKDFPEGAWDDLAVLEDEQAMFQVISFPNTRMPLDCRDFEGYLRLLTTDRRYKLKKKLHRSAAMGPLNIEVVQQPNDKTMQSICELFWKTYEKGKTKFENLTPRFFQNIARNEQAYFVLLRDPAQENKLVAFKLCLKSGSRVIFKYIGIDYQYGGDWFMYFRLWQAAVEWAARMGAKEIQSGQTGYMAKFGLGLQPVPLINFCKHRNRLANRALTMVARHISWSTLDADLAAYVKVHGAPARPIDSRGHRPRANFSSNPPTTS